MFFYSDTCEPGGSNVDVWKMNGTTAYLRHYENYLYLSFIANNERASWQDKAQARKEMEICERKLSFWKKHPNYNQDEATRGVEILKKRWKMT